MVFVPGRRSLAGLLHTNHSASSSQLEVKRAKPMDITEVSRRAGVPASTLRFYEERGLIASVGRRGLHRQFDPRVLEQLALIALGRAAGFSLGEVARMFSPDGKIHIDRRGLAAKADELNGKIQTLTRLRDALRRASVCPAPSYMECPKFRHYLKAAASGSATLRHNNRINKGQQTEHLLQRTPLP